LPVLGVHRLDETLGERHRCRLSLLSAALEPHRGQRDNRRHHRESPIQRVRDLPFDKPVRLPCLADQRIEQRAAAARAAPC